MLVFSRASFWLAQGQQCLITAELFRLCLHGTAGGVREAVKGTRGGGGGGKGVFGMTPGRAQPRLLNVPLAPGWWQDRDMLPASARPAPGGGGRRRRPRSTCTRLFLFRRALASPLRPALLLSSLRGSYFLSVAGHCVLARSLSQQRCRRPSSADGVAQEEASPRTRTGPRAGPEEAVTEDVATARLSPPPVRGEGRAGRQVASQPAASPEHV